MNKRKHKRVDSTLEVWFQTYNKKNFFCDRPKSKNISKGGIHLRIVKKLIHGTIIIMRFRIPGYNESIITRGRIMWVKKIEQRNYNIGIKFLTLREKDSSAIDQFIQMNHL